MTTEDTIHIGQIPFYELDSLAQEQTQPEVNLGISFDSIFRPYDTLDTLVVRQSMFVGHAFPMRDTDLQARPTHYAPSWLFGLLLLITALTCLYYSQRKIKPFELLQSLVDRRAMDRQLRDGNLGRPTVLMPMGMLAVATVSVAIHTIALADTGLRGLALLMGGLFIGYFVKNGLMRVLGTAFDDQAAVSTCLSSNYLYHLALATLLNFLLYPLVYFHAGATFLAYLVLGIVALFFIARLIRSSKLFLTISKSRNFFLFYYLCTIELAPILILLKWII